MMKSAFVTSQLQPITFACEAEFSSAPQDIASQLLDLSNWTKFKGYGPIPGIAAATFEIRTPQVVGSRICVTNTDGSRHVEEIILWEPDHEVRLQFQEFSPPLSYLAVTFLEVWSFHVADRKTKLTRSFALYPKSYWSKLPLQLIAVVLKRAVVRQMRLIAT